MRIILTLALLLIPATAWAWDIDSERAYIEERLGFALTEHVVAVNGNPKTTGWVYLHRRPMLIELSNKLLTEGDTWKRTLVHEYGHIILNMLGLPQEEPFPTLFAVCYSRYGREMDYRRRGLCGPADDIIAQARVRFGRAPIMLLDSWPVLPLCRNCA